MTVRAHVRPRPEMEPLPLRPTGRAENHLDSSAIFSVAVVADPDEVLAFVRTLALLGRSFGIPVSIDFLDDTIVLSDPAEGSNPHAFDKILRSMKSTLDLRSTHGSPKFSCEASIMMASFLAVNTISLQIHRALPALKHQSVPR